MYFWFLVLLFPVALLLFMLLMERYEVPLTRSAPERDVEKFLNEATSAEIGEYVARPIDPANRASRRSNPAEKE
jgi:hypothetical protein